MESKDWAAWISIKTIVESVRIQNISNKNIIGLKGPDLQVDGSKVLALTLKKLLTN